MPSLATFPMPYNLELMGRVMGTTPAKVSTRDRAEVGMTRAFPVCASEAKLLDRAATATSTAAADSTQSLPTLRVWLQLQSSPWTTLRMIQTTQREGIRGHPRRSIIRRALASLPPATSPPLRSPRKLRRMDEIQKTTVTWATSTPITGQIQHPRMATPVGPSHKTQGKTARQRTSNNNTHRRKVNRDTANPSAITETVNSDLRRNTSSRRR